MAQLEAHRGAEVLDESASPKIKQIYDDITSTFRVPIVGHVFREFAAHPEFLELAWPQLSPNVRTVYFERSADELRAAAARGMAHLGAPPRPEEDARKVLKVFHYVDPKLLLAVTALRAATTGSMPVLRFLPSEEKRQIVPGVLLDMPQVTLIDPDAADDQIRATFDEIGATLGVVNSDYRALAQWPGYFGWAWQSCRSVSNRPEYRKLLTNLRRMAENAVQSLPFRVDCSPHTLRLCGMSEPAIDAVRAILDRHYGLMPGLVADIAFLSVGAEGDFGAEHSPFPEQVQ